MRAGCRTCTGSFSFAGMWRKCLWCVLAMKASGFLRCGKQLVEKVVERAAGDFRFQATKIKRSHGQSTIASPIQFPKKESQSMPAKTKPGRNLSLSQKFSRLCSRLREPEWRRYGGTLFAGKIIGVGLVLLVMAVVTGLFFTHVYAQTGTPEA